MARARQLKPSFFTNEALSALPSSARLLFSGLWTIADREGRLEDRPSRIKVELLPYDRVKVDGLLGKLHDAGFIVRYESGGNRYIQIVNFAKHQNVHPNEVASVIPAHDNSSNVTSTRVKEESAQARTITSSTSTSSKRKQRRSIDPPTRTDAPGKDGGDPDAKHRSSTEQGEGDSRGFDSFSTPSDEL